LSPYDEFEAIAREKDANSLSEIELTSQVTPEDLEYFLSPQLTKLNKHLVQVQYRAELLNIQSQALLEQGETAEISPEQQRLVVELEQKLTCLLQAIDLNLHQERN
jgi:hypothetical protein